MALAIHAVGRHGQRLWRGRHSGGIRIEDQQHLIAHAIEQMPQLRLTEGREPEDLAVKGLRRGEVLGVEHGLENAGRDHATQPSGDRASFPLLSKGRGRAYATVSFCSWTNSAMPFLASAISWSKPSCEKATVAAVPCTSTIPPEPVITKLASASALESSA